jgi:hypothetical protein
VCKFHHKVEFASKCDSAQPLKYQAEAKVVTEWESGKRDPIVPKWQDAIKLNRRLDCKPTEACVLFSPENYMRWVW